MKKVLDTGEMVVAGPLHLLQGGTGIIGRAPVFEEINGKRRFWGLVSAVIDADQLFRRVGRKLDGLDVAIRGVDGKGEDGAVFMGDEKLFSAERNAVRVNVVFPSGNWVIAATPLGGWSTYTSLSLYLLLMLVGLATIILISTYRGMRKNLAIRMTQNSLNEAQAIAHLGSWELNSRTDVLWWSDEVYRIFGQRKEFEPTIEGFYAMVHPDDVDVMQGVVGAAINNYKRFSLEHRVIKPDGSVIHVHEQGKGEYDSRGQLLKIKGTVLDVTEQAVAQTRLYDEQQKIKAMAEASYDAFVMVNSKGLVSFWSPAAEKLFGWTKEEAVGKEIHDLIAPLEYHKDAKAGMKSFAQTGKGAVMESVLEFDAVRKDGSRVPVERSVSAFSVNDEYYAVGILRDISERKEFQEELQLMARTDKMTGLFNRGYFVELAEQEVERTRRFGHSLSLIMFDADKFKNVNDTYGHDVGDKVLISIANTVKNSVRDIDIVGRIGGEEFTVLLLDTDLNAAKNVAEKIRINIQAQGVTLDDGTEVSFTVSLGISTFREEVGSFEEMLKRADGALYEAKNNGRNRWECAP